MKCPFCGLDNTRVIDSRPADDTDGQDLSSDCKNDKPHG